MSTPEERFVMANGLRHHVLIWPSSEGAETVLLAHGFLDMAWSWSTCAELLNDAGYRVVAWDWRGHGQTEWVGKGGYYHFPDYVLDLEELWPALMDGNGLPHLIGHSMGGTICSMFAAVRGDKLRTLTLIEGLGPPAFELNKTPDKIIAWLDGMARLKAKDARSMKARRHKPMTIEGALRRMRLQNPELDDTLGLFLAEHATQPIDPDGDPNERCWRFDPMHRTRSPSAFRPEVFAAFLGRLTMPTLTVSGQRGYRPADEAERLASLPPTLRTQHVEINDVGHMIHWHKAEQLTADWLRFITAV